MEAAAEGASDIGPSTGGDVNFTRRNEKQGQRRPGNNSLRSKDWTKFSECPRCGGSHHKDKCKFKEAVCFQCQKKGHIKSKCRTKPQYQGKGPQNRSVPVKYLDEHGNRLTASGNTHEDYGLYCLEKDKAPPIVKLRVDTKDLKFQIDTGATVSVMNHAVFRRYWPNRPLQRTDITLKTYTGQNVHIYGMVNVRVRYKSQSETLPLVVVEGQGPCLLGRNWLKSIKLHWEEIFTVKVENKGDLDRSLASLLNEHKDIFCDELGALKGYEAKIHIEENATPKFCKARQMPFALREGIEEELDRLEREKVIKKVDFSDWATPIVPVLKTSGQVRICGDYKITVNKVAKADSHPLPTKEEMLVKLAGGKKFSRVDLSNAYNQIVLDEESKKLTTINTHRGLYQYQRLAFGISASPAIFQRTIECLLKDIEGVAVFIDDIYVTGKDDQQHLANLQEVLRRFQEKGLRLRKEKCAFLKPEVIFLGHKLNEQGIQPVQEKVDAINSAPNPQNVSQLRSYLGMLNFYGNFLSNLSSKLAPLHKLLQKDVPWRWTEAEQQCFDKSKAMLTSDKLLVHFNPKKQLVISCDASPYGVGAVLAHKMNDNSERPIAYASRSLNAAEQNYAQIDKEGLAVIFAIKKFHKYIWGRKVIIHTDHKPLLGLFGEGKPIPGHASPRIQRWALTLAAYSYNLCHRAGKQNANSDALSRLPLPTQPETVPRPQDVVELIGLLDKMAVTSADIAAHTQRDPVLKQVYMYTVSGWPNEVAENLRPYFVRRAEISIDSNCLLWGTRVIVPPSLTTEVMKELHDQHIGISRMKNLARSWVWWPNMDINLEDKVKTCYECQSNRKAPASAPLNNWPWPSKPWSRLHVDFAGPFMGHCFLIVMDAHSKWLEVRIMKKTTSTETISVLREIFSTHGIPDIVVSDNGTAFTSSEFQNFLQNNGIEHIRCSPYFPATNGQAERAVQVFKDGMKRQRGGSLMDRLSRFLFKYRTTPHSTTGITPAELLMGRQLKSRLDLLHPSVIPTVQNQQHRQKLYHDRSAVERNIEPNSRVFYRNYAKGSRWLPGIAVSKTGPVSYQVQTQEHGIIRRHQDQLRQTIAIPPANHTPIGVEDSVATSQPEEAPSEQRNDQGDSTLPLSTVPVSPGDSNTPVLRRSTRIKKEPERYEP